MITIIIIDFSNKIRLFNVISKVDLKLCTYLQSLSIIRFTLDSCACNGRLYIGENINFDIGKLISFRIEFNFIHFSQNYILSVVLLEKYNLNHIIRVIKHKI